MRKLQSRRLITFKCLGYNLNDDDFVQSMLTFAIDYKLDRQKLRRRALIRVSCEFISDIAFNLQAQILYSQFKESLNIKHT